MFEILKREYIFTKQVQFDGQNKPCICGHYVKTLGNIEIKAFSRNIAEKKALKIANDEHSEYKGFVQLW